MKEIKYYARVIKTGEWVEIDEFHYNESGLNIHSYKTHFQNKIS